MEDIEKKSDIEVLILCYQKNAHLLGGFFRRYHAHLKLPFTLNVSEKPYSDALIDALSKTDTPYVLLLHEEFYITGVDRPMLDVLRAMALSTHPFRVSLQSRDDGYQGATIEGRLDTTHQYLSSLEASIFDRKKLLGYLERGWGPQQTEIELSIRARGEFVYIPQQRVIKYADALRGGQQRIKEIDGVEHVLVPGDTWEPL